MMWSCKCFPELLLTRKLLNQGVLVVELKSSQFNGRHYDLANRYGISIPNDHGYVPFVVITIQVVPDDLSLGLYQE